MIKSERIFDLTPSREVKRNICYWMSREQRVNDNPGLLYAQQLAKEYFSRLEVLFALTDEFPGATLRNYDFMLKGLLEAALLLKEKNIAFRILLGNPGESIPEYIRQKKIGTVIVDFDPLKLKTTWKQEAINNTKSKFIEIDGHNIVPCRYISDKIEFAAYTLRPKIRRNLEYFLDDFVSLESMKKDNYSGDIFSVSELMNHLNLNKDISPVDWIIPGEGAAKKMLDIFIGSKLQAYSKSKNDPNKNGTSLLSSYLHFGQLSSQRVVIEILKTYSHDNHRESFLDELIVRKELSDNFCFNNRDYDNENGFPEWAKITHKEHRLDEREYTYHSNDFENSSTHDPLWNAAQKEMVKSGRMHGYMRMYWAKKIFEWTRNVKDAIQIAIYLNDKYSLDGRDPNGYTGIAWSIGGVHDRAWKDRPVYGKIRYMNYKGCKRKFNVEQYIDKISRL